MSDPIDPQPDLLPGLLASISARLARRPAAAECNPLPANCPFTKRLPKRHDYIRDSIEDGVIPCCRILRPNWLRDEPPLCRVEADEVYRFLYMQAFGAHASIRIAKRRDEITVERRYHAGMFNQGESFQALLGEADWQRLQDTLSAADFWSLPRVVSPQGMTLDGYGTIVEGRRGDEFRAAEFNNPDVERFWMLGRVAFDLGGLADVRL